MWLTRAHPLPTDVPVATNETPGPPKSSSKVLRAALTSVVVLHRTQPLILIFSIALGCGNGIVEKGTVAARSCVLRRVREVLPQLAAGILLAYNGRVLIASLPCNR